MDRLKSKIIKYFLIFAFVLSVSVSVLDSIFDNYFFVDPVGGSYTIVILLYIILHIVIFLATASLFYKVISKFFNKEKERQRRDIGLLFANIAHDIKTPLTSIVGYGKALEEDLITDEQERKKICSMIHQKGERANEMLELMFEYARLNFGDGPEDFREGNLVKLLREVTAEYYGDFEERKIELEIDTAVDVITARFDEKQMRRALSNLIINAFVHNPANSSVIIRTEENRIIIADNGREISPQEFEELKKPFISGDSSRASKEGSGLGLAITDAVLSRHGFRFMLKPWQNGYKAFIIETK